MNQVQQELSTILFSEIGSLYYENPDFQLAPKTLSARAFSHISYAAVTLHKKSSAHTWQGRVIHGIIDGATGALYAVNSLFALTEAVMSIAVTILIVQSRFIEAILGKFAIKTLAYAVHSVLILKVQIQVICNLNFSRYYSTNLVDQQVSHHLATAIAFWIFLQSQKFSKMNFQELEKIPFISAVRVFVTKEPIVELLQALHKDFNPGLSDEEIKRHIEGQSLISFMAHRPEVVAIFKECCENFDLLLDSHFRSRLRSVAAEFVQFQQNQEMPNVPGLEPAVHIIDTIDPRDSIYQKQLQNFVKDAFIEVYKNDTFASYLSVHNTPEAGREALESFLADIYVPLANFAQLKELEAVEEICPKQFYTYKLQANYSSRQTHISITRKLLKNLSPEDKSVLIKSLLKCQGPQVKPSLEILFKNICALAGSLHSGTLMSQQTIQEQTVYISSNNLFQKACMDAMVFSRR